MTTLTATQSGSKSARPWRKLVLGVLTVVCFFIESPIQAQEQQLADYLGQLNVINAEIIVNRTNLSNELVDKTVELFAISTIGVGNTPQGYMVSWNASTELVELAPVSFAALCFLKIRWGCDLSQSGSHGGIVVTAQQ